MTIPAKPPKIARGLLANLPILQDGQLAYTEDTNQLWIGTASSGNQLVGQSSLSSATVPTILSVSPGSGNISSLSQAIVVTFSEAMNQAATGSGIANPANWVLASSTGTVSISSITTTATTATINTTGSGVTSGSTLTLTATTAIQAANGAALASAVINTYSYTFIAPTSAPTILSFSPAAGTLTTFPATIQVAFSKALSAASTSDANSVTNPANWAISATSGALAITGITFSNNVATLTITNSGLISGSSITLAALSTIQDTATNALTGGLSVGYTYTPTVTVVSSNPSPNFQASQEGGRKPAPNYTLNLGTTLATNSCKNETIGNILQLTVSANTALGATGLPSGFTCKWYKCQPITTTTATITGGVTGTYYDPLVPIGNTLAVAIPGTIETDWLWLDIGVDSSVVAGTYSFTLTAGAYTIAVTHTVWNYALPAVPAVPFYVKADGFFAAQQMYGAAINTSTLNLQCSTILKNHRLSANQNFESFTPLANSGDPTQGLNLSTYQSTATSFNAMCVPNTLGMQWMPLHSTYAGLFGNGTGVSYASYVGGAAGTVTGTNYAIATQASLNQAGNAAFRTNQYCYFIDEPDWNQSGLKTAVQTELNAIKAAAPLPKIMMTSEIDSAFIAQTVGGSTMDLVDIWCPIQSYINQSGHVALSGYAGKVLWTYGALRSHTWNFGSGDGSPDLMVDQDSHHAVAYPIVSYVFGAVGTLYYWATGWQFWDKTLGSATDMWSPGGIYGDSGNGDGKLLWVGRSGSYGLTTDQMLPSIRLKNLREGQNLIDMMKQANKDGKDLVTDGLTWRTKYADYTAYRLMIGNMLNGGSYVAPTAAAPGEFYLTGIQAIAGSTNVTCLPQVNSLAPATSIQLWAGTVSGGPYTRQCATYSGTIASGTWASQAAATITLADTGGTAGVKYYYRAKAINAAGMSVFSRTEKSVTFSAANATGPGSIAGLKLWYAADQGVTTDGSGNVTALADLSPTGYNLTSKAGHRPTLTANAYRGGTLPALTFAGSGVAGTSVSTYQSLDSSTTALSTPIQDSTVYIVFDPADATTVMELFCNMARGGAGAYLDTFVNQGGEAFSVLARNATAAAATGLQLVAYTTSATGNALTFYVNGVLAGSSTNGFYSPFINWVRLGAGSNNGGGAVDAAPDKNWFTGKLGELIVYNTAHGSTDRATVTASLKNKWGIA